MRKTIFLSFLLVLMTAPAVWSQRTAGVLTGIVKDTTGGVIPGVEIVAVEDSTNSTLTTLTNEEGIYTIPNIAAGTYTLTVEVSGFKKAVVQAVKITVGMTTTVNIELEIGQMSDTVIVEAAQALVERQTATIASVIEGRQITELPFTSRDTLDLALTQAGTQTPGRARSSTVDGLPKGVLNISLDGIRVQDNYLRSSDGFYTYIRPRIDAIEEFSMSQAGQTSESGGEGAVQLKFVTKRGTNEFHGGAWWYHRNPVLNANYYFNNLAGIPRQRQLLNQVGAKIGGPILKDRLTFFFTIDSFHLPQALSRTATILTPDAAKGLFTYDMVGGGQEKVDLLALAQANGFPYEMDAINKSLLDLTLQAASSGGVGFEPSLNPYTQRIRWNNTAMGTRYFPTLRLDYNISRSWRWEGIWNYQYFNSKPDMLNGYDKNLPNLTQEGSQMSHRFSLVSAVRTSVGPNKMNEFRLGAVGGTVGFGPELLSSSDAYPSITYGGESVRYRPDMNITEQPLKSPVDSRRNSPSWQLTDNFSWMKGKHAFTFGVQYSMYNLWTSSTGGTLPTVSFGVTSNDPADDFFSSENLPGSDTTVRNTAKDLYSMLVGRVSGVSNSIYVGDRGTEFTLLAPDVDRIRQHELGFYFQDGWKVTPTLNLNMGLRWQLETPYQDLNRKYSIAEGGFDGIWGRSGPYNLFAPGVFTGQPTTYVANPYDGGGWYNTDWNNFAPNFGIAWNPTFDGGLWARIFGENPVFRGGYSISYNQEGLNAGLSIIGDGPGYYGSAQLDPGIDYVDGDIMVRDGLPAPSLDPSHAFEFPVVGESRFRGYGYDAYVPNLATGYVQSWSIGIQRQLTRSTVLEFRYVGNKGTKLWDQVNIEEANIFENGFLDEFRNAQENLAISLANGKGNNFSNQGLPGQHPLPTFEAAFGSPTSSYFRSSSWYPMVRDGRAGDIGSSFTTNATRFNRLMNAGYPENYFYTNPTCSGCGYIDNAGWSTYNGLQIELRRRFSAGLLFQGNYTWSHSLSNMNSVSSSATAQPHTLRDYNYGLGPSPFNIYHAFKLNWIYELPFGPGKRWASSSGILNKIAEGWAFSGIARIQSGRGFSFSQGGYGTFNQNDAGVDYQTGRGQMQDAFSVRQTPDGEVFWLPSNMVGGDGRADSSAIAQHTTPGTWGDFYYFTGPMFSRADLTISKKTYVNEGVNVEFRAEFLNAFNNINFLYGGSASGAGNQSLSILSTSFGRITNAFQDTSTTNDLGGRMVQLVLRVNF